MCSEMETKARGETHGMSISSIGIPTRICTRTRTTRRRRRTAARTCPRIRAARRRRNIDTCTRARPYARRAGRGRGRGSSGGTAAAHGGAERTLATTGPWNGCIQFDIRRSFDVGETVMQGTMGVRAGKVGEGGGGGERDGSKSENERE